MTETAVKTETIDDIAAQFTVKAPAEPTAAPQPAASPASTPVFAPKIDPLDESQVNQAFQQTQQTLAQLQAELQSVKGELNSSKQTSQEAQVEGEISKAINIVGEELPEYISPGMVRGEMEAMYRNDPSFKVIWDNRDQNPAAFKKALGIKNQDLRAKFSGEQSQEILDNHKAAQESAQGTATKSKEESDNPIQAALDACKTEGERQKVWARIKANGGRP